MTERKWFARQFELGLSPEALPGLVERLSATSDRLAASVSGLTAEQVTQRVGGAWSVAEQVGHLSDLEPLWLGRVEDIRKQEVRLRPADLDNTATWEANHNTRDIGALLAEFRDRRASLLRSLEDLEPDLLRATALHPRLEQPMSLVDLCFFVAEHDDHHLDTVARMRSTLAGN